MSLRKKLAQPTVSPFFTKQKQDIPPGSMFDILKELVLAELKKRTTDFEEQAKTSLQQVVQEFENTCTDAVNEFLNSIPSIKDVALSKVEEHIASRAIEIIGQKGDKGDPGVPGKSGYTPIKGKDYFDGESGLKGDPGTPGKDGSPDTPNQVVSKVNEATDKIAQTAILNLIEDLTAIKREIARKGGVGGGGMGNAVPESFSVSSATSTITLLYNVASNGRAIWLNYNGQAMHYGEHFTVSGKTVTLLFTPDDSTVVNVIYIRT